MQTGGCVERQNSAERIKQLVEQEGKAARNLVTWSVPIISPSTSEKKNASDGKQPPSLSRSHSNSRHSAARLNRRRKDSKTRMPNFTHSQPVQGGRQEKESRDSLSSTSLSEQEEICKYYSSKTQRQLRSSKSPSKLNLHARYWSYLFDNLHRAVDELYKTCEVDESVVECQVNY